MNKSKIIDFSKILAVIAMGLFVKSLSEGEEYNYAWVPLVAAGASLLGGILSSRGNKGGGGGNVQAIDIFAPGVRAGKDEPSIVQKQATGLTDYLTNQAPGLAALSRSTMQALSPEQAGLISNLQGLYARQSNAIGDFSRRAEEERARYGELAPTLGDISGYTNVQTREKQAKALYDTGMAQTMAEEAFARRGQLSPEEQRMAQQQAREASAASGRIGGNAGIAAEIMNREAAMAARRGEAATLGQAAYGQGMGALQQQLAAQQARYSQLAAEQDRELARRQNLFAQDVGMREFGLKQLLGVSGMESDLASKAAATGTAAFNAAGQFYTTPGLSLLSMPINLASQQGSNAQQAAAANAQIASSNYASQTGMMGNILGSGLQALGSYYGAKA